VAAGRVTVTWLLDVFALGVESEGLALGRLGGEMGEGAVGADLRAVGGGVLGLLLDVRERRAGADVDRPGGRGHGGQPADGAEEGGECAEHGPSR
jgi:hypothetical protein